jgi:hypothetical protein
MSTDIINLPNTLGGTMNSLNRLGFINKITINNECSRDVKIIITSKPISNLYINYDLDDGLEIDYEHGENYKININSNNSKQFNSKIKLLYINLFVKFNEEYKLLIQNKPITNLKHSYTITETTLESCFKLPVSPNSSPNSSPQRRILN